MDDAHRRRPFELIRPPNSAVFSSLRGQALVTDGNTVFIQVPALRGRGDKPRLYINFAGENRASGNGPMMACAAAADAHIFHPRLWV